MTELQDVADLLFGPGGDHLISKMNPTQSDVATKDKRRRALTAGLSAVGAAAGAAGLGYAGLKTGGAYRAARTGVKGVKATKGVRGVKGVPGMGRKAALKHAIKEEPVGSALSRWRWPAWVARSWRPTSCTATPRRSRSRALW